MKKKDSFFRLPLFISMAALFTFLLCSAGLQAQVVTVAQWNNYVSAAPPADGKFLAKEGVTANKNIAVLTRDAAGTSYAVNTDLVAASAGFDNATSIEKYWIVKFSTKDYDTIKVTSKQKGSNTGPKNFKIQYKIGTATTWTDLTGGAIVVANDNYVLGVVQDLPLPSSSFDQDSVFLRWISTSNTSINNATVAAAGVNRIDVTVTGVLKASAVSDDASLSNLQVNGQTINGFKPTRTEYNYYLPVVPGTLPTVLATKNDAAATIATFDQITNVPDTVSVVVTAEDGITQKTYKIYFLQGNDGSKQYPFSIEQAKQNQVDTFWVQGYILGGVNTTTGAIIPATTNSNLALGSDVLGTDHIAVQLVAGTLRDAVNPYENPTNIGRGVILYGSLETYSSIPGMKSTSDYEFIISNDTTLKALTVSTGTLTPAFSSATKSYTVSVPYATTSITVAATPTYAQATIQNSTALNNISLAEGANTINVVVVAENTTSTGTYTIVVTRQAQVLSNDTTLSALTVSTGTLTPAFSSATKSYTVSVPYATTSITVAATPTYAQATIQNPTALNNISLAEGANTINVVVVAENTTSTGTYTIVVTRQAQVLSNDTTLSGLTVSTGTLTPAFSSATKSYTVSVPYATTGITVAATPTYAQATIQNPTALNNISLAEGANTINVVVVAENTTSTGTYTIVVTRQANLSNDTTLKALTVSTGTLTPIFSSATQNYTVSVPYSVTNVSMSATPTNDNATIQNASALTNIALNEGANNVNIVVVAEDGISTGTYAVVITREVQELSNDTTLQSLVVSAGTLSPSFSKEVHDYMVSVPYQTQSITVTAETSDANATIVNASELTDISLNVGLNTVTVEVLAEDGVSTGTYTIAITRAANNDASLKSLTVSSGSLTPTFSSDVKAYSVTVNQDVETITVTAETSDTNATIANVNELSNISLVDGANTISITITAQDEETTETYVITVTRLSSSVDKIDAAGKMKLSVYPNPASDIVTISGVKDNNATVEVYSLSGQKVLEQPFADQLSVKHLAKGIYFVKVIGKSVQTEKLIIK